MFQTIARAVASLLFICLAVTNLQATAPGDSPAIEVGPNVRVSTDSNMSHIEPILAIAQTGVFVAGATVSGGDNNGMIDKAYVSRDGGNTWFSWSLSDMINSDGRSPFTAGDAYVATGAHGRVFFTGLASALFLYYSDDAGRTWSRGQRLAIEDHQRILIDTQRNMMLVAGLGAGKPSHLVFYVSRDNGDSFRGPFTFATHVVAGITEDPWERRDGSVVIPYLVPVHGRMDAVIVHPLSGTASKPFTLYGNAFKVWTSRLMAQAVGVYAEASLPAFAASGNRVYTTYGYERNNVTRVVVRRSTDFGLTWSQPVYVTPPSQTPRDQFASSIGVNNKGTVAVAWSEMIDDVRYAERFSASTDDGKTFLPARTISTRPSNPFNDANLSGFATDLSKVQFLTASGFQERPQGGDYFGLVADRSGAFHPLWIDSSDGVGGQLYTARVTVGAPTRSCASSAGDAITLNSQIQLVFDPTRMDVESGNLTVPVRVQNLGVTAIAGPMTLTVTKIAMQGPPNKRMTKYFPSLVGSTNGQAGVGATFDFSHALGDSGVLAEHEVSEPVEIQLHYLKHYGIFLSPYIKGIITGRRCR